MFNKNNQYADKFSDFFTFTKNAKKYCDEQKVDFVIFDLILPIDLVLFCLLLLNLN